jgi:hypothetical protein
MGHPGRPVQRELIHWVPQIPPKPQWLTINNLKLK